jgi:Zn-finger nucleic acid-binding protein
MQCPVDGSTLQMSERSGIEIDYCPQCRGVWLDRGELDKIIARNEEASAPPVQAQPQQAPPPQQQAPWGQPAYPPHNPYGHGHGHKPYKKHKSFLHDLFD